MKITLDQFVFALAAVAVLELLWGMSAIGYYRLMGRSMRGITLVVLLITAMASFGVWGSHPLDFEVFGIIAAGLVTLVIGLSRIELREWDKYERASRQAAK
jgi:hypothetical protein